MREKRMKEENRRKRKKESQPAGVSKVEKLQRNRFLPAPSLGECPNRPLALRPTLEKGQVNPRKSLRFSNTCFRPGPVDPEPAL